MKTTTIKSTSPVTALCEDIVLRETGTTRLVFRPTLLENRRDKKASVKGTFIFQRKSTKDEWGDLETIPLSGLKKDEGYKLEIKSGELLQLFNELAGLYEVYEKEGILFGETRFVKASRSVREIAELSDDELTQVVRGQQTMGGAALARLVRWASKTENFSLMLSKLEETELDSLHKLNAAVGISSLKQALKDWSDNRNNSDEEFWQKLLANQAFVLEQLFYFPIVIIKSKAYVGGKSVLNRGGNIVDFLVKNYVTNAVGLIEIKTPKTSLLGTEYRTGIHNVSSELSGSVLQVLSYRDSLIQEKARLFDVADSTMESFDPHCVVIVGHAGKELSDTPRKQAFELFRRQLSDVQIVTYDELFERTKRLVMLLEGRTEI